MRFDVLTLFPEIFSGYLTQSLLKLALDRSLVEIHLHNIRDWCSDKHKCVDDRPFGGGPGMVLKPEPTVAAVEAVWEMSPAADPNPQQSSTDLPGQLVMLTPQGRPLNQTLVAELATHKQLLLLCGRYEGFDERVTEILQPTEISLGDFVLNGGEVAAMALIDSVIRLVPGVLGDEDSSRWDSFSTGQQPREHGLLEHAQYTRPREFRGREVPPVLLSGDHGQIAAWRKQNSLERTRQKRPDLLSNES